MPSSWDSAFRSQRGGSASTGTDHRSIPGSSAVLPRSAISSLWRCDVVFRRRQLSHRVEDEFCSRHPAVIEVGPVDQVLGRVRIGFDYGASIHAPRERHAEKKNGWPSHHVPASLEWL